MTHVAPAEPAAAPRRRLGLVTNSIAVMGGKALTMALGFAFWIVAARSFAPADVGLAAGAVSAMMLATQVAILGIGSAFIATLPRRSSSAGRLVDVSLTLCVLSAFAAATAFLALAWLALPQLGVIASSTHFAAAFVVMCVCGTVGILVDQISIATGRGDDVLARGALFGVVALGGLAAAAVLVGYRSPLAIFLPWVLAGLVMVGAAAWQLARRFPGHSFRPSLERRLSSELLRTGFRNWGLTVTERAPGLLLPIVVLEILSPAANAHWYAAWMMAWVIYIIPISVGLSLFAEASRSPAELHASVWRALRAALLIGGAGAAGLAALAPSILRLLGPEYAAAASTPLRVLVIGFVPLAMIQAYYSAARARGELGGAFLTGVVGGVVGVTAAALAGSLSGLEGMAVAWVASQACVASWSIWRLRRMTGVSGAHPLAPLSAHLASTADSRAQG